MRHEAIEMVSAHVGQGRELPPHHKECIRGFSHGDKVIIVPNYPNEQMTGTIQSVEREDGSGYSFNVVIYVNNSRMEKRKLAPGLTYTPSQILKTVYIRFSA